MANERIASVTQRHEVVDELLDAYKLERPITDIIIGPADVCKMLEFKTIIRDTPMDIGIQVGFGCISKLLHPMRRGAFG